jgi:hypothetical protein
VVDLGPCLGAHQAFKNLDTTFGHPWSSRPPMMPMHFTTPDNVAWDYIQFDRAVS